MLKGVLAVSALAFVMGAPVWGLSRLGVPLWAAVCFGPGLVLGLALVVFGLVVALRRLFSGEPSGQARAVNRS